MYLYFDKTGILKEIINDQNARALSSNVNKIFVYIEGMEASGTDSLFVRYAYSTTTEYGPLEVITPETQVTTVLTQEIPYNEKRDLRFFKYFKQYPFFVETVPDEVLAQEGNVLATFRMILNGIEIFTLGLVPFNVEPAVGGGFNVAYDGYVSIAQYNDLIRRINVVTADMIISVDDITLFDVSEYQNGQIFYDKETSYFYKRDTSAVSGYSQVSIPNLIELSSTSGTLNDTQLKIVSFPDAIIKYDAGGDVYILQKNGTTPQTDGDEQPIPGTIFSFNFSSIPSISAGSITFASCSVTASTGGYFILVNNISFYTQSQADNKFVNLTGTQTITGQKTFSGKAIFSDANLYNGYLTTNSKNYFTRVGVTTGQYVVYKLPYNYTDVGAQTFTLETQEHAAGTYVPKTSAAAVVYGTDGSGNVTYIPYSVGASGGRIVQRAEGGQINVPETPVNNTHAASKGYVDTQISTFMTNEYQEVNTTTYPTLNDFLASTGQEGYIYLYPTGEAGDYYRYIWENNAWVNLGTTQMDLTNYVPVTRTIAGVDLQDNITASELVTALGFEFTDVSIDEE